MQGGKRFIQFTAALVVELCNCSSWIGRQFG
jgi:hypothetical protein